MKIIDTNENVPFRLPHSYPRLYFSAKIFSKLSWEILLKIEHGRIENWIYGFYCFPFNCFCMKLRLKSPNTHTKAGMSLLISTETLSWLALIINKNTRSERMDFSCGWVVDEVKSLENRVKRFSELLSVFITDSGYLWLHLISILTWSKPLITLMRQRFDWVAVASSAVKIILTKDGEWKVADFSKVTQILKCWVTSVFN